MQIITVFLFWQLFVDNLYFCIFRHVCIMQIVLLTNIMDYYLNILILKQYNRLYRISYKRNYGLILQLINIQFNNIHQKQFTIPLMIESLKQLCKQHTKTLQQSNLITIHQNFSNHSDYLTVSFLLDALLKGKNVTFLAIRQNYAHYLSLSKKMGKSIEEFGKNGKLVYYQAFASSLCSQLPLTQSSPAVYVRPPKFVTQIVISKLNTLVPVQNSLFIIDCLSFIQHIPSLCYKLYEQAIQKKCKIIIGGCTLNGNVAKILQRQANLWIKLQNDVSGHGKFKICEQGLETGVLWKWGLGKFQISKFMKI